MKKRVKEKKRVSKSGLLTSATFGAGVSVAIFIALITIFSLVGLASDNPHDLLAPFSFFAIYVAAFLGGFISVKKNKGRDALLCGLACGVMIAVLMILTLFIFGLALDVNSTPTSWLYRAIVIASSTVGAILGINKTSKTPRKRKKGYRR